MQDRDGKPLHDPQRLHDELRRLVAEPGVARCGRQGSSGSIRNNYLPEPTMYFFWDNWKAGQTFETAVIGAYRKTIKVMNDAIRGCSSACRSPAGSGGVVDIETFDFVKHSAPSVRDSGASRSRPTTFGRAEPCRAAWRRPSCRCRVLAGAERDCAGGTPAAGRCRRGAASRSSSSSRASARRSTTTRSATARSATERSCTRGNCDGRAEEQP